MTAHNYCIDNARSILQNEGAGRSAEAFANAAWKNYIRNIDAFDALVEFDEKEFKNAAWRAFETTISQPENGWIQS